MRSPPSSWAPAVALGYAAAGAFERWPTFGRAAIAIGLAVVLAGTVSFLATKRYDSDLAVEHLAAVARPGDVIVTRPSRYATLPGYRIGVEQWQDTQWVATPGIDIAAAFRSGDAPPTGRFWLFTPDSFELGFHGYRACPAATDGATAPWTDGVTHVVCLERVPDPG